VAIPSPHLDNLASDCQPVGLGLFRHGAGGVRRVAVLLVRFDGTFRATLVEVAQEGGVV
jgi:hypothetical protein